MPIVLLAPMVKYLPLIYHWLQWQMAHLGKWTHSNIIIITSQFCSHLYIIVVINSSVINDSETLTTGELLNHTRDTSMLFYIAAVINASQYRDGYRMRYSLGAGDNTTDMNGNVFHNRRVDSRYSVFFRVFSADSTSQVC